MSRTRSGRAHLGSRFDKFLRETGDYEAVADAALKHVLAWQLEQVRTEQGVTKAALAAQLKTSRSQLDRLLDPGNSDVTLSAVQRVAVALGRKIRLELMDDISDTLRSKVKRSAAKAARTKTKRITPRARKQG